MASGYWQDLTSRDLAEIDPESTIGVLPVAAIEQHGPHLPLATDALIAAAIVRAALERIPHGVSLLALPGVPIGHSPEHAAFPGTLTARAETLLALWTEVAASAARTGLRKLVILNAHGGQRSLVDVAAVRLRAMHGLLVVRASYFSLGAPPGLFDDRELRYGLHGGDVETSLMLHLHPDLVRMHLARDFAGLPEQLAAERRVLGAEKPAGIGWMSQDLHPEGVCGNAAAATAAKGKAYLDHVAERMATLIAEVAATPLALLRRGPLDD
ncbi:MAG TPA: creatininase family protein [Gammaproteobacteria bacterium]